MRKLLLSATFAFTLLATTNTFAQQGFGTNQPDKSAAVDIVSSKRGLLIPRVALTATDSNSLSVGEITAPANSLFVYNTATAGTGATAVTPGFYYWERTDTIDKDAWQGKWVRFVSTNQEKSVVVDAGENVKVEPTIIGNSTTYTVGVKGGSKTGQVLVTKVTGAGATAVTTTEWVNPESFVQDAIFAENGLTYVPSTVEGDPNIIKLGGALTENTTITTVSGATDPGDNKSLAITGLEEVDTAAHIMVMDANGLLQKMTKEKLFDAKDLTTDGKIVIGATEANNLSGAVLKATALKIKAESLTSTEILNGTIQPVDMQAGGNTTVLVTKSDGTVAWEAQSTLANKDNYNFTAPLAKDTGNDNLTGGKDYNVTIATATDTTLGVVKEAPTNATVNISAAGELSVNGSNVSLSGDVTGTLDATKVVAIQGTGVSATLPEAGQVLKQVGGVWTPSTLTPDDITDGKKLTSTSITVTDDDNKALLQALNIEITPGTVAGQVLTTTGTGADLTTSWGTPNSLVAVNNGLNKNAVTDAIHLGGALIEATTINTQSHEEADKNFTLAITGLTKAPETANKVIVAEAGTGVLRTVDKVVTGTNIEVVGNTDYSVHTPEVVINVTLGNIDQAITFPNAADAPGQVINIKIANTTDTHTGFLEVLDTYGSMPYQGWIVKSNGTAWVIVGRN